MQGNVPKNYYFKAKTLWAFFFFVYNVTVLWFHKKMDLRKKNDPHWRQNDSISGFPCM